MKEIALKAENDSRERSLRRAMVYFIAPLQRWSRRGLFMYSANQVMMQQILLPQAAEGNIEQVLDYEIERPSCLFARGRRNLITIISPPVRKARSLAYISSPYRKSFVDALVDLLESFGIRPAGVEPDVTALLNYLLFAAGPQNSRTALLVSGSEQQLGYARGRDQSEQLEQFASFAVFAPLPTLGMGAGCGAQSYCERISPMSISATAGVISAT